MIVNKEVSINLEDNMWLSGELWEKIEVEVFNWNKFKFSDLIEIY